LAFIEHAIYYYCQRSEVAMLLTIMVLMSDTDERVAPYICQCFEHGRFNPDGCCLLLSLFACVCCLLLLR
jgi:hypothetical protein